MRKSSLIPSIFLLLVVNLFPVFGVIFLGWHASAAAVVYWLETVILAFYLILNTLFSNTWFASLLFLLMYGVLCSLFGAYIIDMHAEYLQLDYARPQADPEAGLCYNAFQFYDSLMPWHIPGIRWIVLSLLLVHALPLIKVRIQHKRLRVDYKDLPIGAMNLRMMLLMLMTGIYAIFLKTGWAVLPLGVIVLSKTLLDIALETQLLVVEKTAKKEETTK